MSDINANSHSPSESEVIASARASGSVKPDYGILAEYATPSELVRAARIVRDSGYSQWDTYTPFPVHGIDAAMGIRPTRLPWIVLGAAVTGCLSALALQWYTNAFDYKWIVSGKPFWSIPAAIPVTFELTVLFSALTALGAMLAMNNLPLPSHPLDRRPEFLRATNDRFFLVIQTSDPKYSEETTRELLNETNPSSIESVPVDDSTSRLPRPLVFGVVVVVALALLPLGLAAKARSSTSREPRMNLVPDMDYQLKYKADRKNSFFADERASRAPIDNTIALSDPLPEDPIGSGGDPTAYAATLPAALPVDAALMSRGRERFGIYCAPCHGISAKGNGMVSKRAEALAEGGWVPPSNLHQEYIVKQPDGQLFNTITKGIRSMPAYGNQIPPRDRWAIVLYLRALQKSQAASINDIPPDQRANVK